MPSNKDCFFRAEEGNNRSDGVGFDMGVGARGVKGVGEDKKRAEKDSKYWTYIHQVA